MGGISVKEVIGSSLQMKEGSRGTRIHSAFELASVI